MWKELTADEELSFRQWARENYKLADPISGVWHPVVQDECAKINAEHTTEADNESK